MTEKSRADFGLNTDKVKIDQKEDFLLVQDDYQSIIDNPINQVLSDFRKEYIKNERLAYDMWLQLNSFLEAFSEKIQNNIWYMDMDIVKMMDNILDRYQNWLTVMRYNSVLGKEKMIEVQKVVESRYTTSDHLNEVENYSDSTLDLLKSNWYTADCQVSTRGYKKIYIPNEIREIHPGDLIEFRPTKKKREDTKFLETPKAVVVADES